MQFLLFQAVIVISFPMFISGLLFRLIFVFIFYIHCCVNYKVWSYSISHFGWVLICLQNCFTNIFRNHEMCELQEEIFVSVILFPHMPALDWNLDGSCKLVFFKIYIHCLKKIKIFITYISIQCKIRTHVNIAQYRRRCITTFMLVNFQTCARRTVSINF